MARVSNTSYTARRAHHQNLYATSSKDLIGNTAMGPPAGTRPAMTGHNNEVTTLVLCIESNLLGRIPQEHFRLHLYTPGFQPLGYPAEIFLGLPIFLAHSLRYQPLPKWLTVIGYSSIALDTLCDADQDNFLPHTTHCQFLYVGENALCQLGAI